MSTVTRPAAAAAAEPDDRGLFAALVDVAVFGIELLDDAELDGLQLPHPEQYRPTAAGDGMRQAIARTGRTALRIRSHGRAGATQGVR